jgi:hypothetical protein
MLEDAPFCLILLELALMLFLDFEPFFDVVLHVPADDVTPEPPIFTATVEHVCIVKDQTKNDDQTNHCPVLPMPA